MTLTAETGTLALSIAKFAWGVGLTVYVFFTNRRKATIDRISAIKNETAETLGEQKKSLEEQGARISCIETDLKHMPSQADIQDLSKRMDKLNGTLNNLEGRLGGINRAVDLMHEFLINRGK